ncbi:MAG TPA: GMC oxidoreductase [Actinocrinis sp.]|nr:GMC oxidoreductase [Actinocrinis sp.]
MADGESGTGAPAASGRQYDVVVVGSGFGGSVAALRLTEKGYRVLVVEAGRRFTRESLPKTSWSLRDYLWAPSLGLYGIQRIHVLGRVMVLAGAGVGGGSLNYAKVIRCEQVILAAGTYGTQTLLHKIRRRGGLPRMSAQLGSLTRTNSEALVGALTFPRTYRKGREKGAKADFTRGVAITSSIHPNDSTHIENVRYGKGSNTMALMCVPQYRADGRLPKPVAAFAAYVRHPVLVARTLATRHWSERTIIGLVMQTHDNSLSTYLRGRRPGKGLLTARQGHGQPNPVHIPEGAQAARLLAGQINGVAGSNLGELLGMPLTAHFLGGCPISADPEHGVIDPYHRVHGHPGISVVDGSAVSANLGVNPSLTITAQAERAMALWPNRGDADPRPAPGAPYRPVPPVPPRSPAVPATAFGRLAAVPPNREAAGPALCGDPEGIGTGGRRAVAAASRRKRKKSST